jgi:hypothetical protein
LVGRIERGKIVDEEEKEPFFHNNNIPVISFYFHSSHLFFLFCSVLCSKGNESISVLKLVASGYVRWWERNLDIVIIIFMFFFTLYFSLGVP